MKEDAITGSETSDKSLHTFLVLSASKADPAKFANFEMHFSYRWTEQGKGGNSGLQFRSKIIDEKTYKVGGYQADLDVNGQYDGGYYDEAGVAGGRGIFAPRGLITTYDSGGRKATKQEPLPSGKSSAELKKLVKPVGEWNTYVLIADKNHMSSKVNGELTAELIDESPKALKDGVIAFQIHQAHHDHSVQGHQDQVAQVNGLGPILEKLRCERLHYPLPQIDRIRVHDKSLRDWPPVLSNLRRGR